MKLVSIGKRAEGIIEQAKIIEELLKQWKGSEKPPCCVLTDEGWKCDMYGPLPYPEFKRLCDECRENATKLVMMVLD